MVGEQENAEEPRRMPAAAMHRFLGEVAESGRDARKSRVVCIRATGERQGGILGVDAADLIDALAEGVGGQSAILVVHKVTGAYARGRGGAA